MVSRKPRRAEGARGFHLLAIAKTSAPQSPKAITAAVCAILRTTPPLSLCSRWRRFSSLRLRRNSIRVAAACRKAIRKRRNTVSPLPQKSRAKPCDFREALFVGATYYRNRVRSPLFIKAVSLRQQGSRKSQRSEIFGKRSTGSAHASFAPRGKVRAQPTATTRVRFPKSAVFGRAI